MTTFELASALDRLKSSNAWDKRYDLPLFPQFNNPFIYLAYAKLALRSHNEALSQRDILKYIHGCYKNGTFTRWPDGTGGQFSHDEVMGLSYLDEQRAAMCINILEKSDGTFDAGDNEKKNMFRLIFLMPFLKACAGYRVGLVSQLLWSIHAVVTAMKYKPGSESGLLKMWLMMDKMKDYPICKLACAYFCINMQGRGLNPKVLFTKFYLTECPVMGEIAPEGWGV